MSKEEIKNLLSEFACEYDFTSWSNDKVYEKFSDLIYKQISDLEAKLAESEKKIEKAKRTAFSHRQITDDIKISALKTDVTNKENRIKELKQQLAEKDEIIDWQNEIVEGVKQEELLSQKLKSLGVDCIEDLGKEHNQAKISFAVEQLRQLKIDLNARRGEYYTEKGYKKFACSVDIINTITDNQIKQLKENKNDL